VRDRALAPPALTCTIAVVAGTSATLRALAHPERNRVRPRHLVTAAVLVIGVPALLWYLWLSIRADLTTTTALAVAFLWLLAAAAVLTFAAFTHEAGKHREFGHEQGSWKPLPSLLLLWIGGFTAFVVFPFMLSGAGGTSIG